MNLTNLNPRRICLIKPSALGDVVQTLPLLTALRERFPQSHISWVINGGLQELLTDHPHLDQIIRFDRHGSWGNWGRFLVDLRRQRFDLVLDLQGLLRTGVMTRFSGAPVRIGLETAREGAHLACTMTIPDTGREVPAHLRYWRAADALGMGDRPRESVVPFSGDDRAWARSQLKMLGGPVLAVHPGARWVTKRWPVEKFAVIAGRAAHEFGLHPVILGSPDEAPIAAELVQLLRTSNPASIPLNLAGRTSLKQLAAVLDDADFLLTNDSGPMHLAAALETPVVGIFTCTSAQRSGPPGAEHELVATSVPCAASYKKQCPHSGPDHMACMSELAEERVWRAVVRMVEKNRAAASA